MPIEKSMTHPITPPQMNNITFNTATEEVIRLDKEGFHYKGQFIDDAGEAHRLMVEFLRQNTQPNPLEPTDQELLEMMPEEMRDEYSYAAQVCSEVTGVKPGIFRVVLNTVSLQYARAILSKWGKK
jgi:hypothetical protein